jgi:hypothetical protein
MIWFTLSQCTCHASSLSSIPEIKMTPKLKLRVYQVDVTQRLVKFMFLNSSFL